jgi:hypothetical protein
MELRDDPVCISTIASSIMNRESTMTPDKHFLLNKFGKQCLADDLTDDSILCSNRFNYWAGVRSRFNGNPWATIMK